jgi:hypothetical protein
MAEAQQMQICRKAGHYRLGASSPQLRPRLRDMSPPPVVIDTQSLLDWLVFRHPACADWPERLGGGGWRWIFTPPMRAEFDHVLAKGFGERWPIAADAIECAWASHAQEVDPPRAPGAGERLHCSDPDDQKFIDLAIAAHAAVLVTRDKALLRLARRARERHGLRICTPSAWTISLPGSRDPPFG